MKKGYFIGLALMTQLVWVSPVHASIKSMVKFFAVEFQSAKALAEELDALPPEKDSKEEHFLKLLTAYMDEIGKLGIFMRDHHEKRKVSPSDVLQSLKAIHRAEIPLISEIPRLLFTRFNKDFLHRRRDEDLKAKEDPTEANQIWYRAIHLGGTIDFFKLFKDDVQSIESPSDNIEKATQFFDWLEENLYQVNQLIEHDGETAFDWVYQCKSFFSESEDSMLSPNLATESISEFTESKEPNVPAPFDLGQKPESQPLLVKCSHQKDKHSRKEKNLHKNDPHPPQDPKQKSCWDDWWDALSTTTFREFRENLGPTLMR